ncbi:MAG: hypothetical protein ACYTHJ_10020 [Planctomycetota bacterium]|jgi:hypothetical protein
MPHDPLPTAESGARSALYTRHLRAGWISLLVYLIMGLVLEILHGLKIDWYLNVAHEARRLMWSLAHAHGTLLGLVNLAFAYHFRMRQRPAGRAFALSSYCLLGSTILLPGGFLLGGIVIHAGDPGKGILLVPVGALMLIISVGIMAWDSLKSND